MEGLVVHSTINIPELFNSKRSDIVKKIIASLWKQASEDDKWPENTRFQMEFDDELHYIQGTQAIPIEGFQPKPLNIGEGEVLVMRHMNNICQYIKEASIAVNSIDGDLFVIAATTFWNAYKNYKVFLLLFFRFRFRLRR